MRKLFFLFTIFCFVGSSTFGQNITFVGSTQKVVVVGQQFRVNYTLTTGGESGKDVSLPEMNDFDNLYGPIQTGYSSSTSIVNGKSSTRLDVSYSVTLMAKNEGKFTIPPATIKVGNSEYKSNAIEIEVLPPDQAPTAASANANPDQQGGGQSSTSGSSSNDVFIKAVVSKNSVYENEGLVVTFKLYYAVDIARFEFMKFPEYDGFHVQEIDMPANTEAKMENYNGRNYFTAVLKQTVLFPQRSGKITIPSGKFDLVLKISTQRRQRSIFDDFINMSEEVKRSIASNAVTIDVKPLPPGKPASFTGAVGDYKMTSSISTDRLKSNDAVTVKIVISGTGNVKLVKSPEISFPNDFDTMDPVVTSNTKVSSSGVTGTKTIEYNAIPRYAGDFAIPKSEFSYFDLKTGTYKTLSTDEFSLYVEQGDVGSGINMPVVNATNKEDIRFLGKDIRYIKTDSAHFHKGEFFFGSLRYLLLYIIPALLFLLFFWMYRNQAAQNANIALVRTKKANKVASKRLKTAAKYLKESKTELFYDEILKAVWGYLSDKLNIPVSALTKDNVDTNLVKYGATDSLIKNFRDILDTAEFARFAPAQGSGKMDELYGATVKVIDEMENTIKK